MVLFSNKWQKKTNRESARLPEFHLKIAVKMEVVMVEFLVVFLSIVAHNVLNHSQLLSTEISVTFYLLFAALRNNWSSFII